MTVPSIQTQNRNDSDFRTGQDISYPKLEYMMYRNPYGYKWTFGVVKNTIGKGIEINFRDKDQNNGKAPEWAEEAETIINNQLPVFENLGAFDRGQGQALLSFQKDKKDSDGTAKLRFYKKENYRSKYDKDGSLLSREMTDKVGGIEPHSTEIKMNKEANKYTFELMSWHSETVGLGVSRLQAIFDTIYGLNVVDSNSIYFAAKVGGGLFTVKVPASKMGDDEYMASVLASAKSIGNAHAIIIIPVPDQIMGSPVETAGFEQITGDQIDFNSIQNGLLYSLAAASGYPVEAWKGSETGLRSSEVNQTSEFDVYQSIGDDIKPSFEWSIDKYNELHGWYSRDFIDQFVVGYKKRYTMSEEDETALLLDKAALVAQLMPYVDPLEISKIVGFTVTKPEPIDMEEDTEEDDEEEEEEDTEDQEET